MIRRGTRSSRALALAIALAPLAAGFGWTAGWALRAWGDVSARIAAAEARLHVAQAELDRAEVYDLLGDAWADYAALEGAGLIAAADAEAASAALAERVAAAFAEIGGRATAVDALDPARVGGLERIAVEARGVASADAAPRLLAALESRAPILIVDLFDAATASGGDALTLRLRVHGYRLTEAGR